MIDGPTLVVEAIEAAAAGGTTRIDSVYAEPDADPSVTALAAAHGVPVVTVEEGSLAKVTSPVTDQAVCARATIPPPVDPASVSDLVLVLVEVADPGNAGTLVRVAEAAGASALLFCGDGVDPWNPKCVRASAGSLFRVPVGVDRDLARVVVALRSAGVRLLAAAGEGSTGLDDIDLLGDVAVMLGNEAHGLSSQARDFADHSVAVPMVGRVESLNVAMTGTVIAFESARQRRAAAHD